MPFTVTWWSKPVQKGQVIFFYSFVISFSIFMFKGSLSKWFIWFQSFILGFLASFHVADSSIRINLNSTNLLEFDEQILQNYIINACCTGNFLCTTLQSIVNAKLSLQGFWHCHENRLIKTIQTIPHNLYVSFKSASLYCGLRLILVYPNPQ